MPSSLPSADFVDYAGLYPPASLTLERVIANYAAYRASPASWMLGRLVLPLDRLDEAEALARAAGATAADPWPVSVLVGDALAASTNSGALTHFRAETGRLLCIESIETAASTAEEIQFLARSYPLYLERFIEIPLDPDPAPLLAALAATACWAKMRTGGVTPGKVPTTALVARFLARAKQAGASLKATAGLHHAIRAERQLTYAADSPTSVMHGFVNVDVCRHAARGGQDRREPGRCGAGRRPSGGVQVRRTRGVMAERRADLRRIRARAGPPAAVGRIVFVRRAGGRIAAAGMDRLSARECGAEECQNADCSDYPHRSTHSALQPATSHSYRPPSSTAAVTFAQWSVTSNATPFSSAPFT